mgnify:FL=1
MFGCSVAQYLLIRRSIVLKIPSQFTNFAMFIVPLVLYIGMAVSTQTDLSVSWYEFFILVILAVFFSYMGNAISLKSIEYAPNPGYSLVISKSYVVFTSIASIFLFNSSLTIRSALAIILLVVCSAIISINKKGTVSPSHVRPIWLPLSIGAFFCWGMLALFSKYLLDIGVPIISRLVYVAAIVSVLNYADMKKENVSITRLSKENIVLFVAIGILCVGVNYYMQLGYAIAPNVGYVNAVNAASIAFVSIGASVFFHDEWNMRKFIGVIGVIAGLILLVL